MYKLSNLAAEDFAAIYEYALLNFGARQAYTYTDDFENTLRPLSSVSPHPLYFLRHDEGMTFF